MKETPIGNFSAPSTDTLEDRLNRIKERIQRARERARRGSDSVCLVGASKWVSGERVVQSAALGLRHFGENRVQEAMAKRAFVDDRVGVQIQHHFIGTLQTNKARKAVELFDLIQSVDRSKLAEALDRICGELGVIQACLVEVKISSEPGKSGISLEDAGPFIRRFKNYTRLRLRGLMTMAPFDLTEEETRRCFKVVKTFFDAQKPALGERPILSMGMSDDFEIAIEEGSNMVRIGRALFGERPPTGAPGIKARHSK